PAPAPASGKPVAPPNQPTGRQPAMPAATGGNGQSLDKDALLKLTPSQRATAREVGSIPAAARPAAPAGPNDDARLAQVDPRDEIVPMSPLRTRVAERLVQAQHESASLTTFNEVDMSAVMDLRAKYKESFEK